MSDYLIIEGLKLDEDRSVISGYNENLIKEIRKAIIDQKVVILKNLIDKEKCIFLRNSILDFYKNIKPRLLDDINNSSPNYHRIDDNPEKSQVKSVVHNYFSFYWNKDVCGETNFLKAMSRFRNIIANLDENYTIDSIEGDWITVPTLYHYPSGGGKINKHADPKTKQFCTILCSLSKKGEDFHEGGSYVEKNEKIDTERDISYGDMFLFDPSMAHGVDPIDPGQKLDWKSRKGRYVFIPGLVRVNTLTGTKSEGTMDYEANLDR